MLWLNGLRGTAVADTWRGAAAATARPADPHAGEATRSFSDRLYNLIDEYVAAHGKPPRGPGGSQPGVKQQAWQLVKQLAEAEKVGQKTLSGAVTRAMARREDGGL